MSAVQVSGLTSLSHKSARSIRRTKRSCAEEEEQNDEYFDERDFDR